MTSYHALLSDFLTFARDPESEGELCLYGREEAPPSPVLVEPPEPVDTRKEALRMALQKAAPTLRLRPATAALLLCCTSDAATGALLKAVAQAVHSKLGPAKLIVAEKVEREGRWEALLTELSPRLILASEGWQTLKGVMHLYRPDPDRLGDIRFLPLKSAATYAQLPEKAALWKQLSQLLRSA